jgi:O-antigen/teichoic acid export membrane protein
MKSFEKIAIAKNVGSSWLGLAVNVATGIVISPFILNRLGDEAFGLWVLVFSVTGYYGLFDLGIRSSVVRYVARFSATGETDELNRVVNTSLFSYTLVCLVALIITTVGSLYIDRVVHIHAGYESTARLLFLMVGSSLALGFPLGVFAGVLEGLQKFYLINSVNIVTTLLRAALIVVALTHGYGLLMVAWITVLLPLVNQLINAINVFRLAHIQLRPRFVSKAMLRHLFNYGAVTFMIIVAMNLRFRTDEIVIGSLLSVAAITPFAIGARIVDYATGVVDSLAQVFTPLSSHFDAKGEISKLRSIFIAGNRACALVIFPICAGLVILGKSVIQVWMGARYVSLSYPVLLVLLASCTLRMGQATTGRILYGMARHKALAVVVLTEGIVNLLLSIVLTRRYGIFGCALGTAIPMTLTCLLFLPQHMCRLLGVRVRTFLAEAYTAPLLLTLPLIAVLLAMQHWFVPNNLLELAAHMAVGGLLYVALVYYFMFVKGPLRLAEQRADRNEAVTPEEQPKVSFPEEAGTPLAD